MRDVGSMRSIPHMVQLAAEDYGDALAVVDGEVSWTFREVADLMVDAVRGMIALGIQPGDRVALCGPNSARWIQAALGVHGAGGVLVPLNTRFKGIEYEQILSRSDATAVITVGGFLGNDYVHLFREARGPVRALDRIVVLDDVEVEGTRTFRDVLATGAAEVSVADALQRIGQVDATDLSDVMFTSGTTGQPKGVMLTHSQSLRAFAAYSERCTLRPGDCFLVVPPFFHLFGYKAGWMTSLMCGVTVLPQPVFDIDDMLAKIERHRVSIIVGPPTIFVDLMHHPKLGQHDVSSLRASNVSAARIPVEVIRGMREVLGFEVVISSYGLTESTGVVTICRPDDDIDHVSQTAGSVIDGVEVTVVDESGSAVPAGTAGEILVRGYTVMQGYWNDPDETAATITPDGWLRTGDVGILHADGYLTLTDRKKDMFIVGGFNAYPAEIEAIIGSLDAVQHVAVVGVPDSRMGEVGVAYVVPTPGASVTDREIIDFARANMANYKVPRKVILVEDLPRNASMKVLKHELRARMLPAAAPED